ncbi:hypothetical protein SB764_41270, partial [Paraburkholderia sp. SIMBA_027]
LVCGVLLGLRRYVGAWVYTAVLVATAVWAVWEVGLDGWSMIPRLIAPAVLGIWIWSPWVAGRLGPIGRGRLWQWANIGFSLAVIVFVV